MTYTAADYLTNHPVLSEQLARWQIPPYPNDSDPRPTPTHSAMQDNFENPDELADYIGLVLADVPHDDIVADFRRGEAKPYYMRPGYNVDAMHLVTILDVASPVRPVDETEWRTLMGRTLRARRHFSPETSNENLLKMLRWFAEAPEHAEGTAALLGRHAHHPDETKARAEAYRNRAFMEVLGALKLGTSVEYLDRMANASEPVRGNSLRYAPHAKEWEDAGVAPEYVGAVARPLESAHGLTALITNIIALYKHGVPSDYVVACSLQGTHPVSVMRAWDNGVSAEYAGLL